MHFCCRYDVDTFKDDVTSVIISASNTDESTVREALAELKEVFSVDEQHRRPVPKPPV